jgi:hypothetical protein
MRLIHPLINSQQPVPVKDYSTAPHLRREATAEAIRIFESHRYHELIGVESAAWTDLTEWACQWLTESLIQGAYVRGYHLWEREVKSYLNGQRYLNGHTEGFSWRRLSTGSFVSLLRSYLQEFSAILGEDVLDAMDMMRRKVNEMKHEPAFSDDHTITIQEYETAVQAIEDFWRQLQRQQIWVVMDPGPHIDRYLADARWPKTNEPEGVDNVSVG